MINSTTTVCAFYHVLRDNVSLLFRQTVRIKDVLFFKKIIVGLRTADCGLRTADCGLRTADCGLRTADCGLRTADCGLRTADYGLRTTDYGLRAGYKTQTGCLNNEDR